jgi:hypothetical protein
VPGCSQSSATTPAALTGKGRRNYAGTSPVTRASGKKRVVAARFVNNDRLTDALHAQAQSALNASPGARAFYDQQRQGTRAQRRPQKSREPPRRHPARLPQNRHPYNEATAWGHRENRPQTSAAA